MAKAKLRAAAYATAVASVVEVNDLRNVGKVYEPGLEDTMIMSGTAVKHA